MYRQYSAEEVRAADEKLLNDDSGGKEESLKQKKDLGIRASGSWS